MNDANFNLMFDFIEILAGLYILYNGIRMKKTGGLENNGLLGKNIDLNMAPDIPGYIKKMFPLYLLFGGIFVALGGASLYMDQMGLMNNTINLVVTGILLTVCVILAVTIRNAQNKYLLP